MTMFNFAPWGTCIYYKPLILVVFLQVFFWTVHHRTSVYTVYNMIHNSICKFVISTVLDIDWRYRMITVILTNAYTRTIKSWKIWNRQNFTSFNILQCSKISEDFIWCTVLTDAIFILNDLWKYKQNYLKGRHFGGEMFCDFTIFWHFREIKKLENLICQ